MAQRSRLQPVAATDSAGWYRELVVDESAATAGDDRRTAGETCPLLLALAGGEPSDETVVWQYAQAAPRAAASGGIAGAAGHAGLWPISD